MSSIKSARIEEHFAELTDPRRRKVTYPLINIVTIAICAVICGADDFVAIAEFGRTKREWLAKFLGSDQRHSVARSLQRDPAARSSRPSSRSVC